MVPELTEQINSLVKEYTTVDTKTVESKQRLYSVKARENKKVKDAQNESVVSDVFAKVKAMTQTFLNKVKSWADSYEKDLAAIRKYIGA